MRSVALRLACRQFLLDLPHRSRRMRRATLPVSPQSSRLSPRASLSKATLTPPVTGILVLPPVSLPFLLAPFRRSRRMPCATPPVVPQPMFIPLPRVRLPMSRLMRRVMLPIVRLASRLFRLASLWRATLTPPATHLVVLPPVSRLPQLARPQKLPAMRLATLPTVFPPRALSLQASPRRSQLTELATSPSVPRSAHPLGLLRLARTLRFPLTSLATSSPLVLLPGSRCLLSPRASRRRSRSTRPVVCLLRLLAPP